MHEEKWKNITLSLAGIFQAAKLVSDLARTGKVDENLVEAAITSILKINSSSILEIYGGTENLKSGLAILPILLNKKTKKKEMEIIRYVLSLIYLEKRFSQKPDLRKILSRRIQQAQSQATHFSTTDPLVIDTLATAFLQTLGQFHYRIQIVGKADYLKNDKIVAKIRVLLLSGIRSTVLWKQMGGSKWHLFFFRKKILKTAANLLKNN